MARPPRASAASTKIIGFRLTEEEERRLDELVAEQGHKDRSALLRSWLAQKPISNGIQFTADEERRLDELVAEQGYENRAALQRAWLDERKPVPEAILARCTTTAQTLFSFVLDEAKRRGLRIIWKSNGFWVNAKDFAWTMSCNESNFIGFDFRDDAESIHRVELATGLWDWYGTKGIRLSIDASHVERVRERIVRIFDTGTTAPKNESMDLDTQYIFEALRRNQDERAGSIYVPDVVRAVEHLVPVQRVHAVLQTLVERGVLELHQGKCRQKVDAALCPPGPRKSVLSSARWKGVGQRS